LLEFARTHATGGLLKVNPFPFFPVIVGPGRNPASVWNELLPGLLLCHGANSRRVCPFHLPHLSVYIYQACELMTWLGAHRCPSLQFSRYSKWHFWFLGCDLRPRSRRNGSSRKPLWIKAMDRRNCDGTSMIPGCNAVRELCQRPSGFYWRAVVTGVDPKLPHL
jgi:hypothetical protein